MLKILVTLILSFVLSKSIYAQEFKDCQTPLVLCGESPFSFDITQGIGNVDEIADGSCVGTEYNSIWIEINVETAGEIIFDIIPENGISDFDFLVLKNEHDDCNENVVVRCMATGATAGNPNIENCIGSTGLQYGETDTVEEPGCSQTDNNYLAPLEVFHGDQYLLLINNFSDTVGFDLVLGGTAGVHCVTSNTSELEKDDSFSIISSNIVRDELLVQTGGDFEHGNLYIINMLGIVIHQQDVTKNEMVSIQGLKTSGTHIVLLQTENHISSKKFIFIN